MTVDMGRRERKKQATREALVDAAFRLFEERGFEEVTVEEISDAVDVSSRTFFRYFRSKEDVVLTFQEEMQEAVLAALRSRPAAEPVLTAVRAAATVIAEDCEGGAGGFSPARFDLFQRMMMTSPGVLGSSLEHQQKKCTDLAAEIALRMGVDPLEDDRPYVVAAIASTAFQTAADLWRRRPGTSLPSLIGTIFDMLEQGLDYPSALPRD
ncbi:TetR family transcriptional regulator [Actinocorallia longicatena]|uniref:TetR family transcriptional regulator n=1 Tax=Actinocorallia longicatena TaxID=111803 RepID=A0ABP6Q0T1_9ACTN